MFSALTRKMWGRLAATRPSKTADWMVAMIHSLVRKEKVEYLVARYGHVIVEECHHLSAVSFERISRR